MGKLCGIGIGIVVFLRSRDFYEYYEGETSYFDIDIY
jgi:hypothetical protein